MGDFKKQWESAYDLKTYQESQTGTAAHSVNDPNTSHYIKELVYLKTEVDALFEPIFGGGTNAQYLRGDKTFQTLNTSVVPEGSNLYWTSVRFDFSFGAKTTTDLTEGTNLYWTQSRFDTAFGNKDTDDLSEGSANLYFTVPRARAAISGAAPIDYSSGDGIIGLNFTATNLYITGGMALNTIQNIHSAATPSFAQLYLTGSGNNTIAGNMVYSGIKSYSNNFTSGWAGTGFRYDYGVSASSESTLEFDNIFVRGSMTVYELIINQIRATNGSLFVSSAARVKSVTGESPSVNDVTFEDVTGHGVTPFAMGDVIYSQRVSLDNQNVVKIIVREVTDLNGLVAELTELGDGPTEVGSIEPGDTFARIGSTSNASREGSIYLTSDDSESPFIDIMDNVTNWTDWKSVSKRKVRLGKLSGIVESGLGQLQGYGLYANNVYLEGDANIRGTITAGDFDGYGNTFYAGRINKNMFKQSEEGNWGDTNSPLLYWESGSSTRNNNDYVRPDGSSASVYYISATTATVVVIFDTTTDKCNSGDQRNRTFTLSFWAKAEGPQVSDTYTSYWDFPINTEITNQDFVLTDDWVRHTFTVSPPNTGDGSNTLRWRFVLPPDAGYDGMWLYGFQFEESDHTNAYQVTDGTLESADAYGMWSTKGGFGGTMQNPRIALIDEGLIIRNEGAVADWDAEDVIRMGYDGSDWGIRGQSGSNIVFELGSTNQIAGWTFDSVKFTKGSATLGFALNTGSTPFITGASAIGFEVYDATDPKMFIGKKDGNFMDYNVTDSDVLTISANIVSSIFSTGTEIAGNATYAAMAMENPGRPYVRLQEYTDASNYSFLAINPDYQTGFQWVFREGGVTMANIFMSRLTSGAKTAYINIDGEIVGRVRDRAVSHPSSDLREGDVYYNTGIGFGFYMYDTSAGWVKIT